MKKKTNKKMRRGSKKKSHTHQDDAHQINDPAPSDSHPLRGLDAYIREWGLLFCHPKKEEAPKNKRKNTKQNKKININDENKVTAKVNQ